MLFPSLFFFRFNSCFQMAFPSHSSTIQDTLLNDKYTINLKRLFTSIFLMTSSFVILRHSNINMSCALWSTWLAYADGQLFVSFSGVGWVECVFCNKIENYKEKWPELSHGYISDGNESKRSWTLEDFTLHEDCVTEERDDEHWPLCCWWVMMLPWHPSPQPSHWHPLPPLQCVCLTCLLRFTKETGLRWGERESAHSCSLLQSLWLNLKRRFVIETWKRYIVENRLYETRVQQEVQLNSSDPKAFSASMAGNAFQESSVHMWCWVFFVFQRKKCFCNAM